MTDAEIIKALEVLIKEQADGALAEIERLSVVLCKDCKHRHKVNTGLAIWQVCHKLNRQTDDDFYCAYGER